MTTRRPVTLGLCIGALGSLAVGGLVAAAFVAMPMALDPAELITAGTEPWANARYAALSFVVLIAVTALGLALWHSKRFQPIGAMLIAIEMVGVTIICVKIYEEYF